MNYKIITDSCCDYPEEALAWLTRVPLSINLGEKTFIDDETMDCRHLLEEISRSAVGPKSACPSPGEFEQFFSGPEQDLYVVTLSKELSGTYNSALQGAQLYAEANPGKNIHIFNSKTAAAGELLICLKIKELAEEGLAFAEVVEQTEAFISTMETLFVLEDLEVMRKSGRMSKVQSVITGTLKIKLVMGGEKDGTIKKVTQALSINQALNKMVTLISAHAHRHNKGTIDRLVLTHCFAKERAEYVVKKVKETCQVDKAIICRAGGISSMYANSGGVIVSFS